MTSKALGNAFKLHNIFNVQDPAYGAKGDGTTDDRAAIQAAVNAALTYANAEVLFPPGTYAISAPIDVRFSRINLNGAHVRAHTSMGIGTGTVMNDGNSSSSIFYAGIGEQGWCIHGSQGSDISCDDVNGVARANYGIEIYSTSSSNHNYSVSDVKVQRARTANIGILGSGYLGSFERINSFESPIGFSINTTSPAGGQGPITFNQCYALLCLTGFVIDGSLSYGANIASDNCTTGISVSNNGGFIVDGWDCEGTIAPAVVVNGRLMATNYFFGTIGIEAPNNTNAYSGQVSTPVSSTGVYVFSLKNAELSLHGGFLNTDSAKWQWLFVMNETSGGSGVSDVRVRLSNNFRYGTSPRVSIMKAFGSVYGDLVSAYPGSQIIDLDKMAYEEYIAPSTACSGAITTAAIWRAVRIGRVVTLMLPAVTGNGVATPALVFGATLPATMRPAADLWTGSVALIDNNVNIAAGGVKVTTAGVISVYRDSIFTTNFTVTATAGLQFETALTWVVA